MLKMQLKITQLETCAYSNSNKLIKHLTFISNLVGFLYIYIKSCLKRKSVDRTMAVPNTQNVAISWMENAPKVKVLPA